MLIIIGNERAAHNLIYLPLDFLMTSIFPSYPLLQRWAIMHQQFAFNC